MIGEVGTVSHASHLELAAALTAAGQRVDALICDPPYSARTHSGHDSMEAADDSGAPRDNKRRLALGLPPTRRAIDYPAWSAVDVSEFVATWALINHGWWALITDNELAPAWESALESAGLYVFAPLPFTSPGSRVRMAGDGPSSWTCWIVVARPKRPPFTTWGTLPGAYIGSPERSMPVVGGKPLWLMRALVRDYSRPGDLVCDPCAGAGTTLVAAKMSGRRFVGGDCDAAHVEIAQRRLEETVPCDHMGTPMGDAKGKSLALFGKDVLR